MIGILVIVWRCTQRRFDNLDNDHDEIKWPELQPDGQTVSTGLTTLNPSATRRTGGAGFEMEKDREEGEDGGDEWGDDEDSRQRLRASTHEVNYLGNAGVGGGGGGSQRGSFCTFTFTRSSRSVGSLMRSPIDDPFLGRSAAPYPQPPNVLGYPPHHSNSPYMHYNPSTSTSSFSQPQHSQQSINYGGGDSQEDFRRPLTTTMNHRNSSYSSTSFDQIPMGVPVVRVSSPASQHRM